MRLLLLLIVKLHVEFCILLELATDDQPYPSARDY
jgi:hypothetical protein